MISPLALTGLAEVALGYDLHIMWGALAVAAVLLAIGIRLKSWKILLPALALAGGVIFRDLDWILPTGSEDPDVHYWAVRFRIQLAAAAGLGLSAAVIAFRFHSPAKIRTLFISLTPFLILNS